jgi:hypothetical protein
MVITQLNITHTSQNKYGAAISATLQNIKITSAEYIAMGELPMSLQDMGKGVGKSSKNNGQKSTGWTQASLSSNAIKKPPPSSGPADRTLGSYNGLTEQ